MNENIVYRERKKICEIEVIDKRRTGEYTYHEVWEEKFGWFRKPIIHRNVYTTWSGGYECDSYANICTEKSILAHKLDDGRDYYIIEENVVYYRPYVHVIFDSKNISNYTKYFDTFEEAKAWTENFVSENSLEEKLIKLS